MKITYPIKTSAKNASDEEKGDEFTWLRRSATTPTSLEYELSGRL
jgi:hypothetical protein